MNAMKSSSRILALAPAVLLAVLACTADAWGCPNCKDTIAGNDPGGSGLVQGYFWSILFMLATPFSILGGMSAYFYMLVRKARVAAAAQPAGNPFAVASMDATSSAQSTVS